MTTRLGLIIVYFLSSFRMGSKKINQETENSMQTVRDAATSPIYRNHILQAEAESTTNSSHRSLHQQTPSNGSSTSKHIVNDGSTYGLNLGGGASSSSRACQGHQCRRPSTTSPPTNNGHPLRKQYIFNATKMMWSSGGLYCSIQEDLNLHEWKFFEPCKQIWEGPSSSSLVGGANPCSRSSPPTEEKCSRRNKNVVKSGRVKTKSREVQVVYNIQPSDINRVGGGPGGGACSRVGGAMRSVRDSATSPANLVGGGGYHQRVLFEDPMYSDLSMSLEPISSSSFHSSSDGEDGGYI